MMIRHFSLAMVFILLPLVSLHSQTEITPKSPLDNAEVTEAARLAVEVAELYKQGKYKQALPLAKRCLEIREKSFTTADEALRAALRNLGEVYIALQKYEDAEPLFQRLIKAHDEFAPNNPGLITALQRLALVKFVTGEHHKTRILYERALEMTEKSNAPDDPKVVAASSYLAEYYQAVGDFGKAEPLYQRIFAIREKQTPTGDSEDFAHARDRYACLLRKIGKEDQARELEKRPLRPETSSTPVAGSVINGRAISMPRPLYPNEARRAHVSGTVLVRVVIDEKGKVIRACAMKGPSLLMRAAEVAAYNAVFTPTKLSGQPVKVAGQIDYNFVAH